MTIKYTIDDFKRIWNETGMILYSSAEFKDNRNILLKPEIKISKQKKIKLNIDKPKI